MPVTPLVTFSQIIPISAPNSNMHTCRRRWKRGRCFGLAEVACFPAIFHYQQNQREKPAALTIFNFFYNIVLPLVSEKWL